MSSTLTGLTATGSVALTDLAYTVVGGNSRKATWAVVAAAFVGGSDTQFQYNNAGVFGGTSGITFAGTGQLAIATGTITDPATALAITQTWNDAADTFTALSVSVTNTASAAASKPFNVLVGGFSVVHVDVAGALVAAGTISESASGADQVRIGVASGTPRILFDDSGGSVFGVDSANNTLRLYTPGTVQVSVDANGFLVARSAGAIGIDDTLFRRDATNTFAQRNGTNAQAFRVYNTFTDGSNYERGFLRWASNVFEIGTAAAGTGTARNLSLQSAGGFVNIFDATTGGASLQFTEQTAPAAGAANTARIFAQDNGAGKTQLMVIFNSGAAQQIAIEP